jgi:ribonucleoside-diphosphate reductase alpha chain
MGLIQDPKMRDSDPRRAATDNAFVRGRRCEECGSVALIRVDGCDRCTVCGAIGVCG